MKTAIAIMLIAATAFAAIPSVAHEHAIGVVKERMDAMTLMAKHHKTIGEHIKSKRDLAAIKADAEAIAALSGHITHLFPTGSTQPPTQARAAIWQNWADFESKATALETTSKALAGTNPADAAAMNTAAAALTRACSGCHERYRTRKR